MDLTKTNTGQYKYQFLDLDMEEVKCTFTDYRAIKINTTSLKAVHLTVENLQDLIDTINEVTTIKEN